MQNKKWLLFNALNKLGYQLNWDQIEGDSPDYRTWVHEFKKLNQKLKQKPSYKIVNVLPPCERKLIQEYIKRERCSLSTALKIWYTNYLGHPTDILRSGSAEHQTWLETLKEEYIEWVKCQRWITNPEQIINSINNEFDALRKDLPFLVY